ncbi:MAG: phosphate ABC transporter permease PstA [Acidobacteriota bacterium]|nr:phosphate ABC transporter permease PstA [Acidobacteriota bacterium]
MSRRHAVERFAQAAMLLSTVAVVSGLVLTVGVIVANGARSLNWEMVSQLPSGGYYLGGSGGVLNAIVGSLILAVGATVLAALVALPVALFLQPEYRGETRIAGVVRGSLDLLWGIPSIVYGAFGFTLLIYLGMRASLMGGIVALALVELPIMARAMDEVLRIVPAELREASYSMGATRWETMRRVVLPQVFGGLITAALLAFGRGIGDAASVLFTAGYTDNLPRSLQDPVASLPLAVFFQLGTPFPEVQQRAHASALILLIVVLIISVLSRVLTRRLTRFAVK